MGGEEEVISRALCSLWAPAGGVSRKPWLVSSSPSRAYPCVLSLALLRVLSLMGPSFTGPRLTHSHISLSGESRAEEAGRESGADSQALLLVCKLAERDPAKPACAICFFFHPVCFLSSCWWGRLDQLHLISVWRPEVAGGVEVCAAFRVCVTLFCNSWTLELYCKHYDSSGLWTLHTDTKQV